MQEIMFENDFFFAHNGEVINLVYPVIFATFPESLSSVQFPFLES